MNDFKFRDCRDCRFVGRGLNAPECRECNSGENFEEALLDTLDMMTDMDNEMDFDYDDERLY